MKLLMHDRMLRFLTLKNLMVELTLLNESIVVDSEIDALGHLNVRFYMERAFNAHSELLKRVGFPADEFTNLTVRRVDTYSRFRNEQFTGAPLDTFGGLIVTESSISAGVFSAYFEIRNTDSGDIAANHVMTSLVLDTDSKQPVDVPLLMENRSEYMVEVPDHGKPRTLTLTTPKMVSLDEVDALISDEFIPGMMSGKHENVVYAEDCDEEGRLREDVDLMFVMHRPSPGEENVAFGPPHLRDPEGRLYSWAMMETRSLVIERPKSGDEIVSLGADVAFGEKWRQSRRWMFVKDTGQLLGVSDSVGVCIDLDERRAIAMPSDVREAIERNCLPQLF